MKKNSLKLKSNVFGFVLTAILIICRAFQPNAEPMCYWSKFSWVLMTLPVLWPLWVLAVYYCASGIALVAEIFQRLFSRR